MTKRLSATLAALTLAAAGAVATAAPASAASAAPTQPPTTQSSTCGTTGRLGSPYIKNNGDRKLTVGHSIISYIYLDRGAGTYYCPNKVYVHSGFDLNVYNSNGALQSFTSTGWHSLGNTAALWGGSSSIRFEENYQ